MNKASIKKFAVESRQKLIKSVIERLEGLGITDKEVLELVEEKGVYTVKSVTLNENEKKNRQIILSKIEEKGYENFIEEVAYTWFNRMIAIRYMEVNDYLPFRIRVLSSEVQGKVDPDIITEIADHIEELELNRDKVIELKEQNKQEELFKYVFIKVCNYLGQFLPVMFEQIEDYTELLLPSVMISNGSVIKDMIELVPEEDWTNQVEIIGWLYQYYISEKKDQVFADLKKNKKITKENIPAATQLFTPEWIVKYMVENSLGRLWLEGHPNKELKSKWKYYLEEAEQEDSVKIGLEKIKKESEILTPEDLTIIDPAMGSGHILVYAFDVLYQIYKSAGYSEKEIPRLILEKNIHGLDIDDRAGQLAYFALMMKARSYSRRLFREVSNNPIEVNVCSIQESNEMSISNFLEIIECDSELYEDLTYLLNIFKDAKNFGSILKIKPVNFDRLYESLEKISNYDENLFNGSQDYKAKLLNLIKQAKIMSEKYNILCLNPPYMGQKGMNPNLKLYLDKSYSTTKSDLFSVFMDIDKQYLKSNGFMSMINQHSWMFLGSFEKFREFFIQNNIIINMIHLGPRAFDEIGGEVVQSTCFISRNVSSLNYKGVYIRLTSQVTSFKKMEKLLRIIEGKVDLEDYFLCANKMFTEVPGNIIAYWETKILDYFTELPPLICYSKPSAGLQTGNNEKFLRYWFECDFERLFVSAGDKKMMYWVPYNKGGGYRKWFGNNEWVINWKNNGELIKKNPGSVLRNKDYYFQAGLTWSTLSTNDISVRFSPEGFLFDTKGSMCFTNQQYDMYYILTFLNSKVAMKFLKILSPTLDFNPGGLSRIPLKYEEQYVSKLRNICEKCIEICKSDWDSFENSYDFQRHPLLNFFDNNIGHSYNLLSLFNEKQICELKRLEQEVNRLFISIYELQDEITVDVEDKDITIRKSDIDREMKSFISYAVGCMMGRYSLDEEGLIYAGGEFYSNKYQTFKADKDGILLISDTEYFEDDLLNRFVEFVKVVYGEETLEENLNFIADTECFKRKATESSRDCLRRYFLKGFMEDHLKVYQKRPIYWMFDSGKQNGFKALIYLHRYNEDTVAKVRTDYLHPLQRKYEAELERLDQLINFESISASEKGKAKKRQEQIHKQLDECTQYDLLLAHVAHQRIALDLDDGVKLNYQKFQNIELTTEGSSKSKKGDLLYKVKM